ncbi:DUF979 domain-containing protein [Clostridium algidicarnis]|uniref:DUF979 domain-containing protein n=2 Tax=Clostridium algidicarnis TaxID=37659 RepID=A0ABS6C2G1_9CLOT|nr:DUF979 domain-containing protein [Clostridium algidicarnis]MBB6632286.1 DUF979 domain-containing protein [Clostridium algidicarnis]MBB6698308.1 DUF979 domain-containing protein [Clostridium algidicarnis]MBU3193618.1 DUF979 domain-containing protein [Clostridium algidicarnis]MBU3197517.1 DUF979 domain-containing protein [Clostridium algidicarnis]MBU3204939.1 DUF979 domain-containing protein [Clostridium algidicarnis]
MDIKQISSFLLEFFYVLSGIIMLFAAFYTLKDSTHTAKVGTSLFWCILAVIFIFGKVMPPALVGSLLLVMGALTVTKQVKVGSIANPSDEFREKQFKKIGGKIFLPSILLAVSAFAIAQWTKLGGQVAIGLSALIGLIAALWITKSPVKNIALDGDRMLKQVGPASILPQLLAALGALFTAAGVGEVISSGISSIIPKGNILAGVIAYCIGMALFTMIMGNGFAAFAVITAGIGVPFVFAQGANPAIAASLALTAGFCGTLMTPMAANFNVVPAALLEMKNKNKVITAQVPVAFALLIVHIILMYYWAF